ncbi:hypothetical protein PQQ52_19240 [Paraburkholderia sediminicola]
MNIDFYRVPFLPGLLVLAAIGPGLSALFPDEHPTRGSQTERRDSRHWPV